MINRAVNEYAFVHARIRARIGLMPDDADWQNILNAGDLETSIETMSTMGLSHWVKDFPREPAPEEIERRCLIGLLGICLFIAQHLPERWKEAGQWIAQLPHVLQIRLSLSANAEKDNLLPGSPFTALLSQAEAQRYTAIDESHYGIYLHREKIPESCWAERFYTLLPKVRGHEQKVIRHITQLLEEHQQQLASSQTPDQVWAQRKKLFEQLKYLLAGNPFHAGTLLIYGLLESIQFERVRAILLLRAYQWPSSLLGGLS